jgi:hypothetical protein
MYQQNGLSFHILNIKEIFPHFTGKETCFCVRLNEEIKEK